MKGTEGLSWIKTAGDGRWTVQVMVRCNRCNGSGSEAFTRRGRPTRYDNCRTCDGWGTVSAERTLVMLDSGLWGVIGWDERYATQAEAAQAVVEATTAIKYPPLQGPPRPIDWETLSNDNTHGGAFLNPKLPK